jgi:predicted esterase
MICEQMIYKFIDFDPTTHLIVAPEGLSRQYTKGFGGEAVATWMTSRDRLNEIEDFSNYLTKLYQYFFNQIPAKCIKVVLGFSQGGTTLFRWLHHSQINVDIIIAYSCSIPEDIDLSKSKTFLNGIKIIYTYGTDDEFLSKKRLEKIYSISESNKLDIKYLPYAGGHKVNKAQLQYILVAHIRKVD